MDTKKTPEPGTSPMGQEVEVEGSPLPHSLPVEMKGRTAGALADVPDTPQNTPVSTSLHSLTDKDVFSFASALEEKLQVFVGVNSGYIKSLPPPVQRRIRCLKQIHTQYEDIVKQYEAEKAALEAKYNGLYNPLWTKRSKVIAGTYEPTDAECDGPATEEDPAAAPEPAQETTKEEPPTEEAAESPIDAAPTSMVGIPDFWLTTMSSYPPLSQRLSDEDRECLKSLVDIKTIVVPDEPESFGLEFHFAPNDYFTNTVLSKTFHIITRAGDQLSHAESTKVEWKEGKNLTVETVTVTKKGRKGRKPKTITKEQPKESFFKLFKDIEESAEEIEDEDELEGLQDMFEEQLYLGRFIAKQMVPNAIRWFTGEAMEDDSDDEDDEDDSDYSEEESDDDESDDDNAAPGKKGAATATAKAQEEPPQCKQQ